MKGRLLSILVASAAILAGITAGSSFAQQDTIFDGGTGGQDRNQTRLMDPSTHTNVTSPSSQSIMPSSANKTFYVFSQEVEDLDEELAGVPGDIFSLPVIVANQGDNITVHFYNTEEELERHAFTIDAAPYQVDIDLAAGEGGNATFTADEQGIFPFYCVYHLPTMQGQLVVLPPLNQSASPVSANATISATANEQFNVTLDSNPTTGYEWQVSSISNPTVAEFVSGEYIPPESELLGAGGVQVMTFNALQGGSTTIEFEYIRPGETGVQPTSVYVVEVTVNSGAQ